MTEENDTVTRLPSGRILDAATLESVKRHVSGATVVHSSPFKDLLVPVPREVMSQQFLEHWVFPLYVTYQSIESNPVIEARWHEMTRDVAYALLAEPNWRTRVVGAYIAALRQLHELTDDVGRLLLRSDVAFAGRTYCLALAQLNTAQSRQYLKDYLDYYLTRPDLQFDQAEALSAVAYLDEINSTDELNAFVSRWQSFVADKPDLHFEQNHSEFSKAMERIKNLIAKHA